jgi:hypothetical protein
MAALFCRCFLAGVFVTAAVAKTAGFGAFAGSIRELRIERLLLSWFAPSWLVPRRLVPGEATAARVIGVLTIGTELDCAVELLWPRTVRPGAVVALALLTAFVLVIVRSMRRRSVTACACFGSGGAPLGPVHLVRNAVLGAAAVLVLAHGSGEGFGGGVPAAGAVCAVGGALIATVLVARLDDLVALLSPAAPAARVSAARATPARATPARVSPTRATSARATSAAPAAASRPPAPAPVRAGTGSARRPDPPPGPRGPSTR